MPLKINILLKELKERRIIQTLFLYAIGAIGVLALLISLGGCLSPIALHQAVLEYDRTVNRVQAEMLLLNIARARHSLPIHFTGISSIAATFEFRANAGIAGVIAKSPGINTLAPALSTSVSENPTVSIIPIQGEEFMKRLLTPMDESKFEFFIHQGVEPAILLRLMARGIVVEEDD